MTIFGIETLRNRGHFTEETLNTVPSFLVRRDSLQTIFVPPHVEILCSGLWGRWHGDSRSASQSAYRFVVECSSIVSNCDAPFR
jgi:hypothetical protein